MKKNLPARPNLDHLRRQAKGLLAALASRDEDAACILREHLPAAKDLSVAQILQTHYRLADAQSATARKTGFAGWPHLARHVEQLRALEGTWGFTHLEIDGSVIPAAGLGASRILIDGDRFRTESPEANYEGIFNINVEASPHEIDIEFVAGPEAGKWNYGIFQVDGEHLEICLELNGNPRPEEFHTFPGSGRAREILKRTVHARPENVTGGSPPQLQAGQTADAGFEFVESATLTRLQGRWTAVKIIRDGQELPSMMLRTGLRIAEKNEIKISFGGQLMIHALVKVDESADPVHVDYNNIGGACQGSIQLGLLKWVNDEPCFCMAPPGQPRPSDFAAPPGSGRTVSQWRLKK
ncbi:MAG TPA: TIGR03067 domain-containing protein [Candidatus Dormibacteraeota bacterium]|nr:TIGR03067 domain-containing protein [Candidatus Dormibacteraeota bacterium]